MDTSNIEEKQVTSDNNHTYQLGNEKDDGIRI